MPETAREGPKPFVLGPDDGEATWFLGTRMTVKATAQSTGGTFGLIEVRLAAGFSPPLHIHHQEDESFWILEGDLTLVCDGQTYQAGPGSFIYLPRDLPHAFRIRGETPARILALTLPGGLLSFYDEVGVPAPELRLPGADGQPMDVEIPKWVELAPRYGIEVVGPPIPE